MLFGQVFFIEYMYLFGQVVMKTYVAPCIVIIINNKSLQPEDWNFKFSSRYKR